MEELTTKKKSSRKIQIALFMALFFLAVFFVLLKKGENKETFNYITQEVKKGDLLVTVTATGNLQALNQVDVGVEVSGTIEKIYVDYNQHVKKGQVLAKLDLSKFEAQVRRAEARLRAAEASLMKSKADFKLAQLHMRRLKSAYKISHGKVPSKIELDEAEAKLKAAEAKVRSAKAEVYEAKADLKYYKTELSKAIVYSPIDGIVLAKHVEEGQTVAAAFQTPILFTLAEDLKRMELHVDVDEADIGQVRIGQYASFTVDAYSDRVFSAKVREVRFAPKIVEGVVTYETILDVDNSDLSLRPGMTATAKIVVKHIKDTLLVPNKAFRFVFPKTHQQKKEKKGLISIIIPHPPQKLASEEKPVIQKGKIRKIWILKGRHPVPVLVTIGATNGIMTQVISGNIQAGTKVILDIVKSK